MIVQFILGILFLVGIYFCIQRLIDTKWFQTNIKNQYERFIRNTSEDRDDRTEDAD